LEKVVREPLSATGPAAQCPRGSGWLGRVLVAVDVDGADEPLTTTYQLKDIERVTAA
jgi:hypothetical protein